MNVPFVSPRGRSWKLSIFWPTFIMIYRAPNWRVLLDNVKGGGRIVKMDLPSLWYCLDGRDTAPEEGCIGGCCCVPLWGGPEELEVAELAGVDGFLCSGVATWWPPPWYPKKSPKSGTHTLSYKFVGTFSREAFAASTSECKTEINPQPECTAIRAPTSVHIVFNSSIYYLIHITLPKIYEFYVFFCVK